MTVVLYIVHPGSGSHAVLLSFNETSTTGRRADRAYRGVINRDRFGPRQLPSNV